MQGGRITSVEASDRKVDGGGRDRFVLPGLIDLQVNGFAGHDVNAADVTPQTIAALTRALWRCGTTSFLPTVITAPEASVHRALRAIAAARQVDPLVAHSIVGVHLEGPYISASEGARGVHDPAHTRDPDLAEFDRWQRSANGLIRIITLAPERAGTTDFIRAVTAKGVIVAIGHTEATSGQVEAATGAGARLSTHLGNGIPATIHRHLNPLWSQLAADRLIASFIADGDHLPAQVLSSMVRAKGVERSVLISDSVALAGSPPGDYSTPVGGSITVLPDGHLRATGTGYMAGSGHCLADCVQWAISSGSLGAVDAIAMATAYPAAVVSTLDRGRIIAGAIADLVEAEAADDGRWRADRVWVHGIEVANRGREQ